MIGFISCEKKPVKETMISQLYELNDLLIKNNYKEALDYIVVVDVSEKKLLKMMPKLIKKKDISKEGIDLLNANANFGKVSELYGSKGKREIKRKKLDANQCFGLYIEKSNIEVMALWKDNKFLFFRLDNIGKLKDEEEEWAVEYDDGEAEGDMEEWAVEYDDGEAEGDMEEWGEPN